MRLASRWPSRVPLQRLDRSYESVDLKGEIVVKPAGIDPSLRPPECTAEEPNG